MRGRNRWSMAVLGLGLALGGASSRALGGDEPGTEPARSSRKADLSRGHRHWRLMSGVCPKCAEMSRRSGGAIPQAPPAVEPTGPGPVVCGECAHPLPSGRRAYPGNPSLARASSSVRPAGSLTPPSINPSALASNGGMPPGFAVVGEASPSTEPEPIGVMRTDYRQEPAPSSWASFPPGRATTWNGTNPSGRTDPTMGLIPAPTPRVNRKSHLLRNIVFGRYENRRVERMRQAHASISYGDSTQPAKELPASMVYGR